MFSDGCFFMVGMALRYSLHSAVRRGVHHGLDLGEGQENGVTSSSRAVREFRQEENHLLSWAGEGRARAGGVRKLSKRGQRASQSLMSQQGVIGSGLSSGADIVIRMGTWSEPVEGSAEASQVEKAGTYVGW